MNLKQIKIQNFRGIEDIEFDVHDYMTLIGPNNCGKSTILRAIEILLGESKPDDDEYKKESESPIVIEGIFTGIKQWEASKPAISPLINDGKIELKRTFIKGDPNKKTYEAKVISVDGWNKSWTKVSQEIKEFIKTKSLNISKAADWNENNESIKKMILDEQPEGIIINEPNWTDECISIDNALQQAIPQAVIIPAVLDANNEANPGAKTCLGKLLKTVVLPNVQKTDEYQKMMTAVEDLSNMVQGEDSCVKELAKSITDSISEILEAQVIFKMSEPDTEKFLGTNFTINLNDGVETPVRYQGHGLQRSLIFALLEAIALKESKPNTETEESANVRSTILLFEEPEIYLHPHLMRKLKDLLINFSERDTWQVITTTHSPFFIDVADSPQSMVILSKNDGGIKAKQLSEDPFHNEEKTALRASLDFHPTVAEAFFAKRTVLVEGDTELAVFKHSDNIHELYGINNDKIKDTTIVSCGGKWTIPAMARVLGLFNIPYRVIHDKDVKGREQAILNALTGIDAYCANEKIADVVGEDSKIYLVEDTFEDVIGIPVGGKEKPYKAWLKIQEIIKDNKADEFPKLKAMFEFAYNW